ncbi:sensor histidine kinase [Kaarinaea lacus]
MFRLSKYLFIVGVPIVVVTIVLLTWMYRVVAASDIQHHSEKSNVILTRTIANVLWPQISGLVNSVEPASVSQQTVIDRQRQLVFDMVKVLLEEPVSDLVSGTNVLKLKLFDLGGLTIYSSDSTQIGVRKPIDYSGIANARDGHITTHMKFYENFKSITGEVLNDRYVLSSYMPIKNAGVAETEGIIEIYSDVTEVYDQINRSQNKFALVLAAVFFVIMVVLFFTLRYLDKVIRNNIDLAVARDSEKDANKAKSQFLANMSHELRTPLNAIIGYSEMLEEEADIESNNQAIQDLEKIQTAAKHLLHIINEILDLSKIEAGQMTLFVEQVHVPSLVDEVCEVLRPLIKEKNNEFGFYCDSSVSHINTDAVKLRQILFNLLSNACKFTQNGALNLNIATEHSWLVVTISDNGIGMTAEQIKRLFRPFMQADQSTTRKFGGTGLGLTISKQYCEMLGGSISVRSAAGVGSSFTVKIPMQVEQVSDLSNLQTSAA